MFQVPHSEGFFPEPLPRLPLSKESTLNWVFYGAYRIDRGLFRGSGVLGLRLQDLFTDLAAAPVRAQTLGSGSRIGL